MKAAALKRCEGWTLQDLGSAARIHDDENDQGDDQQQEDGDRDRESDDQPLHVAAALWPCRQGIRLRCGCGCRSICFLAAAVRFFGLGQGVGT